MRVPNKIKRASAAVFFNSQSFTAAWLLLAACHAGANWPQFRGINGQGVSEQTAPPAAFGANTNLLWRTETPSGHSSPVVYGERIFLTAVETGRLHTLAFDRTNGKLLWRKAAPDVPIEKVHPFASAATPSALADERRVITYFGSYGVLCHDHDGKELWSKAMATPKSTYGMANSPIRAGDTVVVVLDSNDKKSKIVALKVADGSVAWETARPLSASCWATPMVWEHDGKSEIVVPGARRLISYDSANGKELWWMDGFPQEVIGIPVAGPGLLYVSAAGLAGPPNEGFETMSWAEMLPLDADGDGKVQKSEVPQNFRFTLRPELETNNPGRYLPIPFRSMFDSLDGNRDAELTEPEFMGLVKQWRARAAPALKAIRPGGSGDVTQTHVAWQLSKGIPEIPSPLLHKGRLYMVRDGGFVTCADAKTGEVLFQERIGAAGAYCASPVAAGDRVFVASHSGVVTCIAAESELRVLARNNLGEKIWATPAMTEGTIYVRTEKGLHAFSDRK